VSKRAARRTVPATKSARESTTKEVKSDDEGTDKQPWWREARNQIIAAVGVVMAATAVAVITPLINNALDPKPGGAFTPGISVVPRCGQGYALPDPVDPRTQAAELLAIGPQNNVEIDRFIKARRGAATGTITVEITFTGTSQRRTRILSVDVARLTQTANLAGTSLKTPCEGDPPVRAVELDLDEPPRSLMSSSSPYFDKHDLDVTVEERETLRIFASANNNSYRWVFAVRYVAGTGQPVTGYLGTDGHLHSVLEQVSTENEFSLTGQAKSYAVSYKASGGRFYLAED
jgi:hypothetical protein